MRYHYANFSKDINDYDTNIRSRIWFSGKVNDNWNYVGMVQNNQNLKDNAENGATQFQRAYIEGRLGGMQVTAGRHDFQLGDANLYDTRMDGIKVSYGDKVKFGAYYGKPADGLDLSNGLALPNDVSYDRFFGANVGFETGKLSVNVAYDKFKDANLYLNGVKQLDISNALSNNGVWSVQATYDFGNASLGAIFLKSNVDLNTGGLVPNDNASTKGYVITATYGGAQADKVGSFGLVGKYYNQGVGTFIAHTMDGTAMNYLTEGFKGYSLAGYVTVAKNMEAGLEWFDLKGKETDRKERTLWGQLVVSF